MPARRRLRIVAIAALAVFILSAGGHAGRTEDALLIIHRAPNFGTRMWLQIWVDGRKMEMISRGHDFTIPLSPGHHLLTLSRRPTASPFSKNKQTRTAC